MPTPSEAAPRLKALTERWKDVSANERASFQPWFLQFCDALGVPAPAPPTEQYRFELPVRVVDREGELATNFIDAWHAGHFAMEAKMSDGSKRDDTLLRRAFGQVRTYVSHVSGTPPPYLMVVDVPGTLILWDRWSGSYGDFGAGRRIALGSLHERPDDIALLQDVFARPEARDPRGRAQLVTKEIAAKLATLAAALEGRGLDQERVARFLMRCVFSCFAEDVGLLPTQLFRKTLESARASGEASRLTVALELLWKTMDEGGMFGAEMLHRFNGHFFKTREALPLEPADVTLLIEATSYDWSRVEPSIFGTLLVRALDPEERHRLGAEYTPREYIERLVEPTVVEPIREKWVAVQATVVQLEESGKKKDQEQAVKVLLDFHTWMRGLRFLDPACGSGNFLYVTMAAVKRIEYEVLNEIQRVSGGQGGLVLDEVHPRQFHGIEVKPWAREIAELTLWIGYHQFWRETHGGRTPPDPILEDTGTIECRDAILAWDSIVHRPEKDRPDPTPRIVSPVTRELVPDPAAKSPYYEYVNAKAAEWPEADFIVGNPPYVGNKRMRAALGDGYVDALRVAYGGRFDGTDLVMHWWWKAAVRIAASRTLRSGLITTNSITQADNRAILDEVIRDGRCRIIWTVADHPWNDDVATAAVRVTLTVLGTEAQSLRVGVVDTTGVDLTLRAVSRINTDLTTHADVATAVRTPLLSNKGLSFRGVSIVGDGFIVGSEEASSLRVNADPQGAIVRQLLSGKDLTERPRGLFVIDFGLRTELEARSWPVLFDRLRYSVKPFRETNKRAAYREYWWRFAEPRREMREAIREISHYFCTVQTAVHSVFARVPSTTCPEQMLVVIAMEDPALVSVLSSSIHRAFILAAGGTLEDRPRYANSLVFDPFPFPDLSAGSRSSMTACWSAIIAHREAALSRDARITQTKMYNVIEKLRFGVPLSPTERTINELAACGILGDMHDELDRLVAEAYGWPWPMDREEILERLVALHDERVEEEKHGLIRWLRPEYQIPRFAPEQAPAMLALNDAPVAKAKRGKKSAARAARSDIVPTKAPWPKTAVEQISAITTLVSQRPLDAAGITASFTGAKPELVQRHLETLVLMGEATQRKDGRFAIQRRVA